MNAFCVLKRLKNLQRLFGCMIRLLLVISSFLCLLEFSCFSSVSFEIQCRTHVNSLVLIIY